MEKWVLYTFLYAVFMGFFQCSKKKSIERNSIYEVLASFSLISFILTAITSNNIFNISISSLFIILIKSVIIVVAWLLSLSALNKMDISLYSTINLSRIIFTIMLSVIFLGEKLTIAMIVGIIIVILGLLLVNKASNKKENKESKNTSLKLVVMVLFSCLLNAISAIIDKKAVENVTSNQLQFWFLFFLTIIYFIILLVRKKKINFRTLKKNYWIPITAICLTVGDRLLFIANEIPDSKVAIMTIIKQFSAIECVILGKIMFKEKNIIKKLLCSLLIIGGIVLTLI